MKLKWGPINGKLAQRNFEERYLHGCVDDVDDTRTLAEKEKAMSEVTEARINAWSDFSKLTERGFEERRICNG